MKKFFTFLMSLCSALLVCAQTETELKPISVTPADGSFIERIDTILLVFDEKTDFLTDDPEILLIKGTGENTEEIRSEGGWFVNTNRPFRNEIYLYPVDYEAFSKPIILEEGETYTLTIPAGLIESDSGKPMPEMVLTFTGKKEPVPFIPVSVSPESKSEMKTLGNIEITFDREANVEIAAPEVIIRKGNAETGETVTVEGGWQAVNNSADKKTVTIFPCDKDGQLSPIALEEEEKYFITIPEGVVTGEENRISKDIKIEYIGHKDPVPFIPTAISPASGSVIEEIGEIEITFEKQANIEVEKPEVSVRKENAETGETVTAEGGWLAVNKESDKNTVIVFPCDKESKLSPIALEAGISYYVTIPAGIFTGEGKMISEEIKLVFTGKEATAIAENNSEICFVVRNGESFIICTGNTTADVEIFNAAGEIVSRNSNVNGQTTFAPESNGLYIINIKSANGTKTFKVMK